MHSRQALLLTDSAADNYLVRQPYDRGGFNTLGYSSPQELLDDIETLWVTTLRAELGVSREELAVSHPSHQRRLLGGTADRERASHS